jgi:hypothetical protein
MGPTSDRGRRSRSSPSTGFGDQLAPFSAIAIGRLSHMRAVVREIPRSLRQDRRSRLSTGVHQGVAKPGRNDACPCGSGKIYKRCCIDDAIEIIESASPTPRFVNRADDLKRATLAFIDDCSYTLCITSNAAGTTGQLPRTIPGEAIREVYQRLGTKVSATIRGGCCESTRVAPRR